MATTIGGSTYYLPYELYRDSARSLRWGNTLTVDTASGTGTGSAQQLTIYGRVPPVTGQPRLVPTTTGDGDDHLLTGVPTNGRHPPDEGRAERRLGATVPAHPADTAQQVFQHGGWQVVRTFSIAAMLVASTPALAEPSSSCRSG